MRCRYIPGGSQQPRTETPMRARRDAIHRFHFQIIPQSLQLYRVYHVIAYRNVTSIDIGDSCNGVSVRKFSIMMNDSMHIVPFTYWLFLFFKCLPINRSVNYISDTKSTLRMKQKMPSILSYWVIDKQISNHPDNSWLINVDQTKSSVWHG